VKHLLDVLLAPIGLVRNSAAEALVSIYKSGKLDDTHMHRVLQFRDTIIEKHDENYIDYDPPDRCDGVFATHDRIDRGIGVDFLI
jgi:hypothetical protein